MAVSLAGVVMSSLVFRLKNKRGDTVGFFLGETHRHSVAAITDSECHGTREEKRTCIQQHVIVDSRQSFTYNIGDVDFDKLDKLLEHKSESIVGWFVYRCNTSSRLSLYERRIHRHLMTGLPHAPGKDLLFCLFNEYTTDNTGLLSLDYCFYQWIGSQPQPVHVDVVNLQLTGAVPYQRLPIAPIPSSVQTFKDIMEQTKTNLLSESRETMHSAAIEQLYKTLLQRLEPLKDELSSSYHLIHSLEKEVQILRDQLKELHTNSNIDNEEKTNHLTSIPDSVAIPPLIQLGDENTELTHLPSNGSVPQIDLLAGSPPPSTYHTPLTPTADPTIVACPEQESETIL